MSAFELDYLDLVNEVLEHGECRESRVGDTRMMFGKTLHIDCLREGRFPILTHRKMYYGAVLGELAAFLEGAIDLATFKKYGCNYWDANAAAWAPNEGLSPKDHKVGQIYGAQWRSWDYCGSAIDQLQNLVDGIADNPFSRRHLLTTYNPSDLDDMCLPPCHLLAQFSVGNDGTISCIVTMRSVDLVLGLPADIMLYAALLLIICQETEYAPGDLIFMMGDTHVYENHVAKWKDSSDKVYPLPAWDLSEDAGIDQFEPDMLNLIDYRHGEKVTYVLNV